MNSFVVEAVGCLFTAIDGNVKILLMRKKTQPYKDYWILPSDKLNKELTLEENMVSTLHNKTGYSNIYMESGQAFSALDRVPNKRVLAFSFISLLDSTSLMLKKEEISGEIEWFDITMLPKLGYDHERIIKAAIEQLQVSLRNIEVLKRLYPSDFSLPELQKVYEQILNVDLDRRNFRKKILNSGLLEPTGEYQNSNMGRPAALYRFQEA